MFMSEFLFLKRASEVFLGCWIISTRQSFRHSEDYFQDRRQAEMHSLAVAVSTIVFTSVRATRQIPSWRDSHDLSESSREMSLINEACICCNIRDCVTA